MNKKTKTKEPTVVPQDNNLNSTPNSSEEEMEIIIVNKTWEDFIDPKTVRVISFTLHILIISSIAGILLGLYCVSICNSALVGNYMTICEMNEDTYRNHTPILAQFLFRYIILIRVMVLVVMIITTFLVLFDFVVEFYQRREKSLFGILLFPVSLQVMYACFAIKYIAMFLFWGWAYEYKSSYLPYVYLSGYVFCIPFLIVGTKSITKFVNAHSEYFSRTKRVLRKKSN